MFGEMSVQRGPNGTFVYVVKEDKTVTVRPITLTQQDDLRAVVATGLKAGEQVVTTGFARIAEGTMVQVTNAEEAGQVSTGERPERQRGGRGGRGGGEKGKGAQTSGGKASTPP